MKIEAVPVLAADFGKGETSVVRLRVTGPVDPSHRVLLRARQLVTETGSKAMAESFDWAISTGVLTSDK